MKNPSTAVASAELAPHHFTASTLFSLVVFAAITPLLLLVAPAVAAQLGSQLGLSASQVGTYFFVELGAFSCATLPSFLWLGRVDARRVAAYAVALFCAGNFATAVLIPGFAGLLVLRAITSLGGGTLMVLCMTSAATSANRDRVYGLWVVGQLLAGAVGLLVLPHLFSQFGLRTLYVVLGLLGLCAAPLTCGFDLAVGRMPRGQSKVDTGSASFATIANTVLVIGGVLGFYVAIGGVWTFAGKAAALAGLDAAHTGEALAVASVMGIVGAACASLVAGRVTRFAMLLTGYALLAGSLAGLAMEPGTIGFMAAVFVFKFAWTFVLPFILAAAAKHDRSGRLIASLNLVIGAGLAAGPLMAGMLLDMGASLATLFAGAALVSVLSSACLLRVERH